MPHTKSEARGLTRRHAAPEAQALPTRRRLAAALLLSAACGARTHSVDPDAAGPIVDARPAEPDAGPAPIDDDARTRDDDEPEDAGGDPGDRPRRTEDLCDGVDNDGDPMTPDGSGESSYLGPCAAGAGGGDTCVPSRWVCVDGRETCEPVPQLDGPPTTLPASIWRGADSRHQPHIAPLGAGFLVLVEVDPEVAPPSGGAGPKAALRLLRVDTRGLVLENTIVGEPGSDSVVAVLDETQLALWRDGDGLVMETRGPTAVDFAPAPTPIAPLEDPVPRALAASDARALLMLTARSLDRPGLAQVLAVPLGRTGALGRPRFLGHSGLGPLLRPVVSERPGGFAVMWSGEVGGVLAVVDESGVPDRDPIPFEEARFGFDLRWSGGRLDLAYNDMGDDAVFVQALTPGGTRVGAARRVSPGTIANVNPRLVAIGAGTTAVVWQGTRDGGNDGLYLSLFDERGVCAQRVIACSSTPAWTAEPTYHSAAFGAGTLGVVWRDEDRVLYQGIEVAPCASLR